MALLRGLVALLLAWLAIAPSEAVADPSVPPTVYAYDGHASSAPGNHVTAERSPLAAYDLHTIHEAVDRWLRGTSARSNGPTQEPTHNYDPRHQQHVQVASVARATERPPRAAPRGMSALVSAGAAANTGSRLAEVSNSAFRAADNVGDFTVSAKHLPGAGGRWNKWAEGVDINGTIASALRSDTATFLPNATGAADSFIVRTNVGSVIGTKGQTYVKAVISNDGRIITAYPVK